MNQDKEGSRRERRPAEGGERKPPAGGTERKRPSGPADSGRTAPRTPDRAGKPSGSRPPGAGRSGDARASGSTGTGSGNRRPSGPTGAPGETRRGSGGAAGSKGQARPAGRPPAGRSGAQGTQNGRTGTGGSGATGQHNVRPGTAGNGNRRPPAGQAPVRNSAGPQGNRGTGNGRGGKRKKKSIWQKFKEMSGGRKALIITMIVLLVLILTVVIGGYLIINGYIKKTNYVDDKDVTIVASLPEGADNDGTDPDLGEEADPDVIASLNEQLNNMNGQEAVSSDYVYNLLLIGVDRRDTSWAGNSDAMLLVSINSRAKKIFVTSLMRDTYVSIPGIGNKKLNAAHAHGAGPLLVQTVTQNFKVNVDRYARVDFNGLTSIIDQLGGIPMTLSDAEAKVANDYIREMNGLNGRPANENLLNGGGDLYLNGIQATAYARIRYVGNADWGRTERQRKVLEAMIGRVKSAGIGALPGLANSILPLVTHNVPDGEIWGKIAQAPEIMGYEIVMDRIPYDGMYTSQNIGGQGMLVPDWPATVSRLQSTIYATE